MSVLEISTFPSHFQNPSRISFLLAHCVSQKRFLSVLWKTFCLTALSSEETLLHNQLSFNWFYLIFILSYNPQQNCYPSATSFHEAPYKTQGKLCWLRALGVGNERQQGLNPVWDSGSATELMECKEAAHEAGAGLCDGNCPQQIAEHGFPSAANSEAPIHCCFTHSNSCDVAWLGCAIYIASGGCWVPLDRSLPSNRAALITIEREAAKSCELICKVVACFSFTSLLGTRLQCEADICVQCLCPGGGTPKWVRNLLCACLAQLRPCLLGPAVLDSHLCRWEERRKLLPWCCHR